MREIDVQPYPKLDVQNARKTSKAMATIRQDLEGRHPEYKGKYASHEPFPTAIFDKDDEQVLENDRYNGLLEEAFLAARSPEGDDRVAPIYVYENEQDHSLGRKYRMGTKVTFETEEGRYEVSLDREASTCTEFAFHPVAKKEGAATPPAKEVKPLAYVGPAYGKMQAASRLWQVAVDFNEGLSEEERFRAPFLRDVVTKFREISRELPIRAFVFNWLGNMAFEHLPAEADVGKRTINVRHLLKGLIETLNQDCLWLGVETRWDLAGAEISSLNGGISINMVTDGTQLDMPEPLGPDDKGFVRDMNGVTISCFTAEDRRRGEERRARRVAHLTRVAREKFGKALRDLSDRESQEVYEAPDPEELAEMEASMSD